jgi:hypothetical protein
MRRADREKLGVVQANVRRLHFEYRPIVDATRAAPLAALQPRVAHRPKGTGRAVNVRMKRSDRAASWTLDRFRSCRHRGTLRPSVERDRAVAPARAAEIARVPTARSRSVRRMTLRSTEIGVSRWPQRT